MEIRSGPTVFEQVGGTPWFVALIDRFYDAIETDPVVRPMYPPDLAESRSHMVGFLQQFWGGPTDYSDDRGHPRLRMRHAPFAIGQNERNAWLGHMRDAVRAGDLDAEVERQMVEYFERASTHMINK